MNLWKVIAKRPNTSPVTLVVSGHTDDIAIRKALAALNHELYLQGSDDRYLWHDLEVRGVSEDVYFVEY